MSQQGRNNEKMHRPDTTRPDEGLYSASGTSGDAEMGQNKFLKPAEHSVTHPDSVEWSAYPPSKSQGISAETRARWELLRALAGVEQHGSRVAPVTEEASQQSPGPYTSLRRNRSQRKRQATSSSQSSSGSIRPLMLPQMIRNRAEYPKRSKGHESPIECCAESPPSQHYAHQAEHTQNSGRPNIQHSAPSGQPALQQTLHDIPQEAGITHTTASDYILAQYESRQPSSRGDGTKSAPVQPSKSLVNALLQGFPNSETSSVLPERAKQSPLQAAGSTRQTFYPMTKIYNVPEESPSPKPLPVVATSRSPAPSSMPSSVQSSIPSSPTVAGQNPRANTPVMLHSTNTADLAATNSRSATAGFEDDRQNGSPPASGETVDRPRSPAADGVRSEPTTPAPNDEIDYSALLERPPEEVLILLASGKVPQEFLSSPEGMEWIMNGESALVMDALIRLTVIAAFLYGLLVTGKTWADKAFLAPEATRIFA